MSKTKAVIRVNDKIVCGTVYLDKSLEEVKGQELKVILNKGSVCLADNPQLRKYVTKTGARKKFIVILFSEEYEIILEKPMEVNDG
ncbi:hypothetical protein VOWphi5012_047 [Vibrio phage phi50-12]|uniref:Uncharacterized protein n=1 Tax=Vibrio phage phi50-12 TaxID=2654972 RepID=A0A5P8PSR7_9CAUD|nr:hypothetical protein KNU82_gp047 [Vibrio phage phi50-12]QFR59831.1 hypothetical protein VOWphi5012_047 [Vibrio phage phi50-12]